ncbi:MAG TPA: signal peptide peptidase SppA [Syntrophorhabdaceae bacterium]|jgi:protease-4
MKKESPIALFAITLFAFAACGCGGLHVNIGAESKKEPLKEYVLQGKEGDKVLVVPIRGFLSDAPKKGLLHDRQSVVEEVVAQLRLAEKDERIKALVLEIDSPGGSVTASDILYREITDYKERTKSAVVAVLMDVAASGGYYIALAADRIVAHPTTITGSVGVVFISPKVEGLMGKLGVTVDVSKSGKEKDMASPFRPATLEETKILQSLTDSLGARFVDLTVARRNIDPAVRAEIAGARIYLAEDALRLRLIDRIGYVKNGIAEARGLAGLPQDAKIIAYRRAKYPNDNVYNTSSSSGTGEVLSLAEMSLSEFIPSLRSGFYYLWAPGIGERQ